MSVYLFYFFILPLPLFIDKVLAPYMKIVKIYIHTYGTPPQGHGQYYYFGHYFIFFLALMIDKPTEITKIYNQKKI